MTAAIIRLDQSRPTGGPGSNGIARNDLWQNRLCTLTSVNAAGAYQWTILDKPPGSTASLTNPTSQVATFTPDKSGLDGTYRVMLGLDGGGPDSLVGTYMILVFRARYDVNGNLLDRGWCMPAVGEELLESNYSGNTRGYDEPWRLMMHDVLASVVATSATPGGDLAGGSVASAQVVGLRGIPIKNTLPNDGDVPTYVAGATDIEWKAPTIPDLVGDTHGPIGATITSRLRGAAIATAAGALVLGTVLQATGASTLDYAALDLSNANATANQLAGSKVVPNFGAQDLTARDGHFTRDVIVGGNLTIQGTTTTVDSTTIDLEARMIHANFSPIGNVPVPIAIAGLEVERGDTGATRRDAAGIIWNEGPAEWTFAFQTSANDTAIGSYLQIKALGATLTSLSGGGSGYATVNNNGTLGFTSTIGSGALSPGSAGQVFITDVTPLPVWTSLISVELTHGRFTAGGTGSDARAIIGPLITLETSYSALHLLVNGQNPTSANPVTYCDGSNAFFGAPNGSGIVGFTTAGAYIGAFSGSQLRFYTGGVTASAPFIVDWATTNQTQIFSGTSATSFLIANTNGFASIIMQPGAAGIIFKNPTGSATVATLENTHGRFTAGGGGSDRLAIIGPSSGAETSSASLYLLPNATAPTGANFQMQSDGTSYVSINAPGGGYTKFLVSASIYGAISSNSGVIGALWLGNIVPSGTNYTIQSDGAAVTTIGAGTPIVQLASGTQGGVALGANLATAGHFRGIAGSQHYIRNSGNSGNNVLYNDDGSNNLAMGNGYSTLAFNVTTQLTGVAGSTIAWESGADMYLDQTTLHLRSAGHVEALTITPASTTSIVFTENASSGALIGYAARTSNNATSDLKIQGQYAFGTATLTSRTPGSIVFDIGAPQNGGTTEAGFKFTRGGSEIARVATHPTTTSQIGFWLGSVAFNATQTNAALLSDASSYTYLNSPGALGLLIADAAFLMYMPGAANQAFWFGSTVSSPFYFDVTTVTTPFIAGGTASTSFTLKTTKVGAAVFIQTDNALNAVQYDHPTNQIRTRYYDQTGAAQLSQTVDSATSFVTWTLASSAWEFEWLVGTGEMLLANNLWATGGASSWWVSASSTTVYIGGLVSATAPVIVNFTTSTVPTLLSGSNATAFLVGTNKSGSHLSLCGDNAIEVVTIRQSIVDIGNGNSPDIIVGAGTLYFSGAGSSFSGTFSLLGAGVVVLVDSSGGVVTANLPASASLTSGAATYIVADFAKTFGTNKCTFVRNGSQKINGVAANYDATSTGAIYFVIFDGTDWIIRGT